MLRKLFSSNYLIGIFLTGCGLSLGLAREFLLLYLLGLSAINDQLQLYLSIFYISGLSIDGIRLGCLNLFGRMTLSAMMCALSVIVMPFILGLILLLYLFLNEGQKLLLGITFIGCYLNLLIVLWITYLQRQGFFVFTQCLNLLPNFIFIPGIFICYLLHSSHFLENIVIMSAIIPVFQGGILFIVASTHSNRNIISSADKQVSLLYAIPIFGKQFLSVLGEQGFQIVLRAILLRQTAGMLSLFSILTRMIAALRFILIDTYINFKLGDKNDLTYRTFLKFSFQSVMIVLVLTGLLILIPLHSDNQIRLALCLFLAFGFCLTNMVRIIYFRMNHIAHDASLILKFSFVEMGMALIALLLSQFTYSLLLYLWLGYIVRPIIQWTVIKRRSYGLENSLHALS